MEEYNRGSAENPMTYREIRGKFSENASAFLSQAARDRLADEIGQVERLPDASVLVGLAVRRRTADALLTDGSNHP